MAIKTYENVCSKAGSKDALLCPNYDVENYQPKDCSKCEYCPYYGYDMSTMMKDMIGQ